MPSNVDCLGSELDGSLTLFSVGEGKNRFDAVEQSKKNAVNAVLFKGFSSSSQSCSAKPLILTVNGRTVYEDYFNTFFRDSGAYNEFVSFIDEKNKLKIIRRRIKGRLQVHVTCVVRVDLVNLKKKLIKDSIL